MDSSTVTESIEDAWTRTRALLLEGDFGRWLKYGFIAMLGSAAATGGSTGFNFSPPMGSGGGGEDGTGSGWSPEQFGPEALGIVKAILEWLTANLGHLVMLAIGLAVLGLVLGVALAYARNVFRFIFVEAVAARVEPAIGDSFGRHARRGLSLLLWKLVLGLVPLLLIVIALVPMIGSIGLIASGDEAGLPAGIGSMMAVVGLVIFALLLLMMGQALTEDFLVPAMYARRCGVVEGWGHVARAWQGELGNVIVFYLLKIALGIAAGIVTGIAGLVSLVLLVIPAISVGAIVALLVQAEIPAESAVLTFGGPALVAIILGGVVYAYLLNVALLPIGVFFQAYSLSFVGRLDRLLRTI